MISKKLVRVAVVVGAHGIKGEVKLRSYVEYLDIFSIVSSLFSEDGKKEFSIKVTGKIKNTIIIKFDSVDDRNSAELLKNTELFICESVFPVLDDGEFYHSQLIGLEVRLEKGEKIGVITSLHNYGAGDLIEITKESGEVEMFPLQEPWVGEINIKQGFIIIALVEYL